MARKILKFVLPASTLKSKIFRRLLLFTTIPFIFASAYIFFYTNQRIVKEYNSTINGSLAKCSELINEVLVKYIDKSSYIITNQYLIKNIQKDYSDDLEQMMYFLENIGMMIGETFNDNIKRPYIIYPNNPTLFEGKFVDQLERVSDNELIKRAFDSSATEIIWETELTVKNGRYLTFYRNIIDFNKSVGVIEVNIPYIEIEKNMSEIGMPKNGLIFSTDNQDKILYLNNQTGIDISSIEFVNEKDFLIANSSMKNGHKITAAVPRKEIYKKRMESFSILVLAFLAYIVLMLIASKLTTQRITGSLERFINKIRQDENLLLNDELIQVRGNDEISFIKKKFKELMSKVSETYREMANVKIQNSALEIELLQSRINPHLLYNSLSIIKWSAIRNKDNKTVEMIDAMTKYYRTALNKGNNVISISSELEMIKDYVKINEYSHSAKYNLELDVEEEIVKYYTLKHLLQPVVENSILHGLNGKGNDALIIIRGYMEGEDIVFNIIDNGRGMSENTINSLLNLNYTASYGGYGIKNLIKRIQVYYGSCYGISIKSEVGEGTTVTVRIEAFSENELMERMNLSLKLN